MRILVPVGTILDLPNVSKFRKRTRARNMKAEIDVYDTVMATVVEAMQTKINKLQAVINSKDEDIAKSWQG